MIQKPIHLTNKDFQKYQHLNILKDQGQHQAPKRIEKEPVPVKVLDDRLEHITLGFMAGCVFAGFMVCLFLLRVI